MNVVDEYPKRYFVGGLAGALLLGIPAAVQNEEHRAFGFAVFGTLGALMGAGAVALIAPARTCPAPIRGR